jgi:hypothetical protein
MDTTGQVAVQPSGVGPRFAAGLKRVLICGLIAALGWFYWWTITGDGMPLRLGQKQDDYFNLLMHGFLSGHLHLMRPVSPGLLTAENPYDPAKRPPNVGMHDMSYYRGHYYLYFGVTPVVTLFLPFRLLTGVELPLKLALWILAYGGFLAGASVWLSVRRRYYPASGLAVALLGLLILGVVSLVPALVRRPSFWELPIASGYGFSMLAVAGIYGALHSRRPAWWLAGAAMAMGLAVGSRPTYVFGCALLAVPLIWFWWRGRREARWSWWPGRSWWWLAAVVAVPLGLLGAGLALYNYLRFGNPLEFGLKYQLTNNYEMMVRHFRWRFIPFNTYLYFFAPAQWGRYFPFVHFVHPPRQPDGYYGWEYVWGAAVNLPIVWLALLAPWASWRRGGADGGRLGALGWAVGVFFAVQTGTLLCFNTSTVRYTADFMPALALAAGLGLLVLERSLGAVRRRTLRWGAHIAWGGAALFSVFVAAMISVQIHGILPQRDPLRYRRVAYGFNLAPAWIERALGTKHGPLEITLRFPRGKLGVEPVLATGWEFYSDRLLVEYLNDREVRLLFDHTSRGSRTSGAIPVDFSVPHLLRVEMGSLFPPAEHPFYDGMSNFEVAMLTRRLRVTLDGHVAFDCNQTFYEASPESVRLGADPIRRPGAPDSRFSGEILRVKRGAYELLHDPVNVYGSLRMTVRFRREPPGYAEPLLSTGVVGKGNLVYVRYGENGRATFGIDQWGWGATEGPAVELDDAREHELEIRLGSLYPPGGTPARRTLLDRAMIRLDGRLVFNRVMPSDPVDPANVWIGMDCIGSDACVHQFQGLITQVRRVMEGPVETTTGGPVCLNVTFPTDRAGQSEPLVETGRPGAGDILIVRYLDARTIQFGHDHWGSPLEWSPPVEIDYASSHVIETDLPARHPDSLPALESQPRRLRVKIDGRPVWDLATEFYPAAPQEVYFGANPIGGSTCDRYFQGAIFSIDRPASPTEDTAGLGAGDR